MQQQGTAFSEPTIPATTEISLSKLHASLLPAFQVVRNDIDPADQVIGYRYAITFTCANGNVPTLGCNTDGTTEFTSTNADEDGRIPPLGRQCQVTAETDGSFVSGTFTLSTLYPHVTEGTQGGPYTTDPSAHPLSWRATASEVDAALEARLEGGDQVFGAVTVERHVYWPPNERRWSGQYDWSITFDDRPGDVPLMTSVSTMTANDNVAATLSVGEGRDGNEVAGGFGLSFCPNGEDCPDDTPANYFDAFLTGNEFKKRFSEAFFTRGGIDVRATAGAPDVMAKYAIGAEATIDVKDWLRLDGNDYTVNGVTEDGSLPDGYGYTVGLNENVAALSGVDGGDYSATFGTSAVEVTRTGPTQAMGYAWQVTFSNKTVGGNQPDVESPAAALTGSGATIVISETHQGNQLTGTFTLSYDGRSSPLLVGSSQF